MSRENVEIVQRAYVALSQGDSDAIYDLAPPEFVVDFSRRLVDPFVLRGRDEALSFFLSESREGAWEGSPVWEPQELIEVAKTRRWNPVCGAGHTDPPPNPRAPSSSVRTAD